MVENVSSSPLSVCSWQIVTEMKESEQEVQEGAKTLECTMRGVLREQHLEKYIAPHHWDSLMNGPVQVGLPGGCSARGGSSHRSYGPEPYLSVGLMLLVKSFL